MIAEILLGITVYVAYKTGQAYGHNDAMREKSLVPVPVSNCADPIKFCDNCACGKKARVLASFELKRK